MSFMDSILEFWDGQALTVQEESRTNGNIFDMESGGAVDVTDAQMGFLYYNLTVGTAAGGMASGAYFQIATSDSATFSSGVEVIGGFGSNENPLFASDLAAGARFSTQIPMRQLKRYVEYEWIPINEAASGLVVNAWQGMEAIAPLNTQKEPV